MNVEAAFAELRRQLASNPLLPRLARVSIELLLGVIEHQEQRIAALESKLKGLDNG